MKPVKRYLEYRKVLRFEPCKETLEEAIRLSWAKLPGDLQRVIQRSDGSSVMGFSMTDHGKKGVCIHCVRYVDQQGVGVIPMAGQASKVIGEKKPLATENFLNQDFFLLASGDHVITLNAATGAGMARTFLVGLFKQASLPPVHEKFDLVEVPRASALRRIAQAGGVSSIQLDWGISELAADYISSEGRKGKGLFGAITGRARELVGSVVLQQGAKGLAESQKGTVRLTISVPDGDVQVAKNAASAIGQAIIDDDGANDFLLKLKNGDQIRKDSVSRKKLVTLQRNANSFVVSDVEREMLAFMDDLNEDETTKIA